MKSVCVFCGSRPGADPLYAAAAQAFGEAIAASHLRLVYGGGNIGLMGTIASATLAAGGEVVGVIPKALLAKELAHPRLTELRVVESMHERKATMAELADGFVAMPGGIGTLEEFFEAWTAGYLGMHSKPIVMLDTLGHYDGLLAWLRGLVGSGYVAEGALARLIVVDDVEAALAACAPGRDDRHNDMRSGE